MPIPRNFDDEEFRRELQALFPEKSSSLRFDADQWFRVRGSRLRRFPRLSLWGGLATGLAAGLVLFSLATAPRRAARSNAPPTDQITLPRTPKGVHITARQALTVAQSYVRSEMSKGWTITSVSEIKGPQLERQSGDISWYPTFMWVIHLYNPRVPTGHYHYLTLYIDGQTGRIAVTHRYNK